MRKLVSVLTPFIFIAFAIKLYYMSVQCKKVCTGSGTVYFIFV